MSPVGTGRSGGEGPRCPYLQGCGQPSELPRVGQDYKVTSDCHICCARPGLDVRPGTSPSLMWRGPLGKVGGQGSITAQSQPSASGTPFQERPGPWQTCAFPDSFVPSALSPSEHSQGGVSSALCNLDSPDPSPRTHASPPSLSHTFLRTLLVTNDGTQLKLAEAQKGYFFGSHIWTQLF